MENSQFDAICSQLLTQEDLKISKEIFDRVKKEGILTQIDYKNNLSYIKIYSLNDIYLSAIVPILHNFGFEIVDEITYNIACEGKKVYIIRFNLDLEKNEKMDSSKNNIEYVISESLKYEYIKRTKLFLWYITKIYHCVRFPC